MCRTTPPSYDCGLFLRASDARLGIECAEWVCRGEPPFDAQSSNQSRLPVALNDGIELPHRISDRWPDNQSSRTSEPRIAGAKHTRRRHTIVTMVRLDEVRYDFRLMSCPPRLLLHKETIAVRGSMAQRHSTVLEGIIAGVL